MAGDGDRVLRRTAPADGQRGEPLAPWAAIRLREVAAELSGQAEAIAAAMAAACAAEIPAYGQITDAAWQADTRAADAALVRCWLAVMPTAGQLPSAELLRPLTEGARRRAVQGIGLQSLLRAYRIGIRVMWSEITAAPAWHDRVPQAVLAQVATWLLGFTDHICTLAAAAYADELTSVTRRPGHRRSALLNMILAGPGPEHATAPAELRRPHCVVVARVNPDRPLTQLEDIGQALGKDAGTGLWTIRYGSVIATTPQPAPAGRTEWRRRLAALTRPHHITAVGIGGRSENVADTCSSYHEAAAALQIGSRLGLGPQAIYDYQQLAPLIALMSQPAQARRFTTAALESLGELTTRTWTLPTLEAYLARQGHLKEVAAALNVHPNTIKYRLNVLRPYIQANLADGDQSATMLLALRLHRLLTPPSTTPADR